MMNSGADSGGQSAADKAKQDALYEDREPKKIIRIITVTAYMVSVSFVGIVLSAYYIFLWHPPNPRLMHAQAMDAQREGHADRLIDVQHEAGSMLYSSTPLSRGFALNPGESPAIDGIWQIEDERERTKMRREIVKNVNSILKANFEAKSSKPPPPAFEKVSFNENSDNNSTPWPEKKSENSSQPINESSAPNSAEKMEKPSNLPTTKRSTTVTSTAVPPLRRTKSSGRKQHQTPFALKHLEVPIKPDRPKKKLARFVTTTARSSAVPLVTKGAPADLATPVPPTTTEFIQRPSIETQSHQTVKGLLKTLTTPISQRDADYSSSTDLPELASISPDQFKADDYHDATVVPVIADEIMDD